MSEPFKPESAGNEAVDKSERAKSSDSISNEPSTLTFTDLDVGHNDVNSAARFQSGDGDLGRLDIEFGAGASTTGVQGQAFRQMKASFSTKPEVDKPMPQIRSLIEEFLKNTALQQEEHSSTPERDLLAASREALSNATNAQDALSELLHLGRIYQNMRYIEEAKKAIELALGIDPSNYQCKQLFRDLERMQQAEIGAVINPVDVKPLTKSNLRKRILNLTGGKVIVVGDLLIDELLEGKPERISREAPVLILEHVDTELIPGGAANTANNIASLGGYCHAIGVCGDDEYAGKMAHLFDQARIKHSLVKDHNRPTTVKTRILSKSHSFKQQLLRLDRISHERISTEIELDLLTALKNVSANYSAVILSDYRAGVMTDALIRGCRAIAAESNLMLIVDAQDDFARFQNVSLLTPNQPDTEKAVGFAIKTKEDLQRAGDELMLMTGAQALLLTRGSDGMVLFQQNESMVQLPAFNKSEVFDVSGAGDTVVATMTLALVTGSTYVEAMALGNLAAGIVVKKPGTAVTSQKELLENLDMLKISD